ncbi:pilus assembly protein PilM [bacterium]|nr:pilus assembly protein PilM [bacterium]
MFLFQQSLGIDFREDTLRLVLLGKTIKGTILVDHLIKRYPNLADKPREGEAIDELVADLNAFFSDRSRPSEVILGIPRQKVILREIHLPALEREELKEIITFEIEKHIPLPSQEIYYDYQTMEKVSESENRIMLGLIKKEDMDFYLNILERAQLIPTLATPLSYVLKDCPGCNHFAGQDLGAMVDIGEKEIEIDLLQGSSLVFSRSLSIKDEGLDEDSAMTNREPSSKDEEEGLMDKKTRAIGTGLLGIVKQMFRTIKHPVDEGLARIVLTGMGAYDLHLSDFLHESSGIDVYIPNPFHGLTEKSISGRKASALAMATGLAVKGLKESFTDLNLLPVEMRVRRTSHAFSFAVILLSLLFLLLTATAYTGFGKSGWFYLPKRLKLERVVNTSKQLQDQVRDIRIVSQRIDETSKKIDEIRTLMKKRVSKLEILQELSAIIPESVWLDKADIANDKIEINGYADASSSLIGIMEDSPLLENVIFPSTITKRPGEKERFRIIANIQRGLTENGK